MATNVSRGGNVFEDGKVRANAIVVKIFTKSRRTLRI